jgi:hypothetical protein
MSSGSSKLMVLGSTQVRKSPTWSGPFPSLPRVIFAVVPLIIAYLCELSGSNWLSKFQSYDEEMLHIG